MTTLLTKSSAKLDKSQNDEWLNRILYLEPNYHGSICPNASAGCRNTCLVNSGRMKMQNAVTARHNRTKLYFEDRSLFIEQLKAELLLASVEAKKAGKKLAVRLNGTSDIDFSEIYKAFPNIQFYEYTKTIDFINNNKLDNVHFTFSKHEKHSLEDVKKVLKRRINVAVVFKDKVPSIFKGIAVIDGDKHDRRFEDKEGNIIGLKFKGSNKDKDYAVKRGFALEV